MRILALFLLLGTAAFAQRFLVGVRGGVPLTNAFRPASGGFNYPNIKGGVNYSSDRSWYAFGPSAEIRLPLSLGIGMDALYDPLRYRGEDLTYAPANQGDSCCTGFRNSVEARAWDVSVLARKYFGRRTHRPYVAAGGAANLISSVRQDYQCYNFDNPCVSAAPDPPREQRRRVVAQFAVSGARQIPRLAQLCQGAPRPGTALVHRIPSVGLKCVSERRRREMAALVGGTKAAAGRPKIPGLCPLPSLTSTWFVT